MSDEDENDCPPDDDWHITKRGQGRQGEMPLVIEDSYKEPAKLPELAMLDIDKTVRLDSTIYVVGKRRTGKSWFVRDLLYHLKDKFECGVVISGTNKFNHFWSPHIPERFIHEEFDPAILENLYARQFKLKNEERQFVLRHYPELKNTKELNDYLHKFMEKHRAFILLDDVLKEKELLRNDPSFLSTFTNGRHYHVTLIMTTQYVRAMPPIMRNNVDHLVCFTNKQLGEREALWENYCSRLTKPGFQALLDAYTEDNELLFVDMSATKSKLYAQYFWYKAEEPPPFKIGDPKFWADPPDEKQLREMARFEEGKDPYAYALQMLHAAVRTPASG